MSKAWMNLEAWHRERRLDAEVGVDQTSPEQRAEEEGLYRRDPGDENLGWDEERGCWFRVESLEEMQRRLDDEAA